MEQREDRGRNEVRDATLAEAEMRLAVQSGRVGLWALDLRTRRARYSAEWTRQTGYEEHELGDDPAAWRQWVHPDDLASLSDCFRGALSQPGKECRLELRFRHKDGEYRWIQLQGAVVFDEAGGPLHALGSHLDITERKRVEEELRRSEHFRERVLVATPMIIYVFDIREQRNIYCSRAIEESLGYAPEEIVKMGDRFLPSLLHPDDVRRAGALLDRWRTATDADVLHVEYRIRAADGSWRWFHGADAVFQRDEAGQVIQIIGAAHEITDRKRSELVVESLLAATAGRLGEDFFRSLVENLARALQVKHAFVGALAAPDSGRVQVLSAWMGEGFADTFEYDLAGTPCAEVVNQGTCVYPDSVSARFPQDTMLATLGIEAYLGAPLGDPAGRVIGLLVVLHDQPLREVELCRSVLALFAARAGAELERLRMEEAHRQSELRFRSLIENTLDVVTIVDGQGILRFVSPSARAILGVDPAAVMGRSAFELMHAEDTETGRTALQRVWDADPTLQRVTLRLRHVDGSWRWLEAVGKRMQDGTDTVALITLRDLTEQRELEEQILQSRKMEAIGQLAGGVAHDFNNILTVIQGHASLLLLEEAAEPAVQESVREIAQAAARAADLTRQLLAFGRRQVMQPRVVDLNELVASLYRMLGRILGEDIRLRLELPTQPARILADRGMIDQVLLNLAVNARDAMPRGGELAISVEETELTAQTMQPISEGPPGRYACLIVKDTGEGIPAAVLPRIFEPFFTTKALGRGTGLGLATVFGIVRQHGGWIRVASEVGAGTVFRVFLPTSSAQDRPAELPETGNATPVESPGGSECILLVEDDDSVRAVSRTVLERYGYRVLEAANGTEALREFEQRSGEVRLLLTDIVMPGGLSGFALAERLLERKPDLKVVFTSGYSAEAAGRDLHLKEGQNFLPKPCTPRQLLATIRRSFDS